MLACMCVNACMHVSFSVCAEFAAMTHSPRKFTHICIIHTDMYVIKIKKCTYLGMQMTVTVCYCVCMCVCVYTYVFVSFGADHVEFF
jgi:hypothetical protein